MTTEERVELFLAGLVLGAALTAAAWIAWGHRVLVESAKKELE